MLLIKYLHAIGSIMKLTFGEYLSIRLHKTEVALRMKHFPKSQKFVKISTQGLS